MEETVPGRKVHKVFSLPDVCHADLLEQKLLARILSMPAMNDRRSSRRVAVGPALCASE